MGHNSGVSGHLKSIGIQGVDRLSIGPRIWSVTSVASKSKARHFFVVYPGNAPHSDTCF